MEKKNKRDLLAINGGEKIRNIPYPKHSTMINHLEEENVLDLLRDGELSGFSARPGDRFLGGKYVKLLEEKIAKRFDVKHAITFNSATSAAHAAVSAGGIGPGDEIITSPFTMSATASSILMQGAVPVFADIEDRTYGLDPQSVLEKITNRTKGILTVNIFGHPSRLDELRAIADSKNILLMEDNAQSPTANFKGQLAGTVGEIGILSLNYHKVIQTGEGGVALTNDDDLALHMQLKRNHGEVVTKKIGQENMLNQLGFNYRLPELCAAVGAAQIDKIDILTEKRVSLAEELTRKLAVFDFIETPCKEEHADHVYYLYPFKFYEEKAGYSREKFAQALLAEGVSILEGYMQPLYLEPIYQSFKAYGNTSFPFEGLNSEMKSDYAKGICPTAEKMFYETLLTTDICKYPNEIKDIQEFVDAIEKVHSGLSE
tara:strand:+ start:10687 stop:11976 length:1290 start_codon:yes stop_codon:yes gene_type:complete